MIEFPKIKQILKIYLMLNLVLLLALTIISLSVRDFSLLFLSPFFVIFTIPSILLICGLTLIQKKKILAYFMVSLSLLISLAYDYYFIFFTIVSSTLVFYKNLNKSSRIWYLIGIVFLSFFIGYFLVERILLQIMEGLTVRQYLG